MCEWLCASKRSAAESPRHLHPDDPNFIGHRPSQSLQEVAAHAEEVVEDTVKAWLQSLPFPAAVTAGIISGAFCGAMIGWWRFLLLFVVISIVGPRVNRWIESKIATWLKEYIEEVDRTFIGVDIHIGKINLSICHARVVIHNLKIDNPQGYKSNHLMVAKQLVLDLDLLELVRTRGRHVVVEEFKLQEVEAIMEFKGMVWGTGESNLQAVQDFVSGPAPHNEDGTSTSTAKPGDVPTKNRSSTTETDIPDKGQGEQEGAPKKKGRVYTLQKVEFIDISARPAAKFGAGAPIHCADMRFKYFSEEFNTYGGADLLVCLVKTLTKSMLKNVIKKGL